jgi:hypothetical protein
MYNNVSVWLPAARKLSIICPPIDMTSSNKEYCKKQLPNHLNEKQFSKYAVYPCSQKLSVPSVSRTPTMTGLSKKIKNKMQTKDCDN